MGREIEKLKRDCKEINRRIEETLNKLRSGQDTQILEKREVNKMATITELDVLKDMFKSTNDGMKRDAISREIALTEARRLHNDSPMLNIDWGKSGQPVKKSVSSSILSVEDTGSEKALLYRMLEKSSNYEVREMLAKRIHELKCGTM